MANVTETSNYDEGVYQLETTDPLEGGPLGTLNKAAKNLANRTKWLKDNLTAAQAFKGELKWINGATPSFISTNFPAGVGVGTYAGWAIANGANGTTDMGGLVPVAYGNTFNNIGAIGGSADAVVVSHSHASVSAVNPSSEYNSTNKHTAAFRPSGGDVSYGLQGTATAPGTGITSESGVSGIGKNMQPYRVVLCIEKL